MSETFAYALFCSVRVGVNPATEPIGSPLHAVRQVSLVHAPQRVAQLRGCLRLRRRQVSSCVPQILFQLRKIVGELLAVLRQFVARLHPGRILGLRVLVLFTLTLASHAANPIRLGMLFLAQTIALAGERIEFARCLLLLRTAQ